MTRGAIVIADGPGEYGNKRRPFLVVQSDVFNEGHASIVLCPITTTLVESALFRVTIAPTPETGLKEASEIQIDKVQAFRRERIRAVVGAAPAERMIAVDAALRRWLDL